MKIVVVGGGPSGLYFALLAKKYLNGVESVKVYEQNPRDATFGFGIVLADRGLDRLRRADAESCDLITRASFQSRNRIITHRNESIFIEGGGYGGAIARLKLLQILQDCCDRAGVEVTYSCRKGLDELPEADLIVGADGVNSVVRNMLDAEFGTTSYDLTAKMAWYGTRHHFPYPILSFRKTDAGQFWCVGYAYSDSMGTFVAECDAETWKKSGLSEMSELEAKAYAEKVFEDDLGGEELICNKSLWGSLPVTRVKNWSVGNKVLIGDALHSAHPSIGSGTRIAMEDSIALLEALQQNSGAVMVSLAAFRKQREPAKLKLVHAAEKSIAWYENIVPRLESLSAIELVFDYMMRTGRVDEARLVEEYPFFMEKYRQDWNSFNEARNFG